MANKYCVSDDCPLQKKFDAKSPEWHVMLAFVVNNEPPENYDAPLFNRDQLAMISNELSLLQHKLNAHFHYIEKYEKEFGRVVVPDNTTDGVSQGRNMQYSDHSEKENHREHFSQQSTSADLTQDFDKLSVLSTDGYSIRSADGSERPASTVPRGLFSSTSAHNPKYDGFNNTSTGNDSTRCGFGTPVPKADTFGGFRTPNTTNYNENDTFSKGAVEDNLNVKESFGDYHINGDSGPNAGIGGHRFTTEPAYHVNDKADERVALSEVVTNERPYLSLALTSIDIDEKSLSSVHRPLGTCHDPVVNQWAVADERNHRVYLLPSTACIYEEKIMFKPSAVCVVVPGVTMAILCARSILLYHYQDSNVTVVVESKGDNNFRGLCATPGGNLLTMYNPYQTFQKEIVIYDASKINQELVRFELPGAKAPSFLDIMGHRLVISDLGGQKLFLCYIDDTNKNQPKFVVEKDYGKRWLSGAEPNGGFRFVSGVHIFKDGKILVADAKARNFQLFDEDLNFMYHVSTDFPGVYTSDFTVSPSGMVMLCDRQSSKLLFCRLTAQEQLLPPCQDNLEQNSNQSYHGGSFRGQNSRGRGRGSRGRGAY